MRRPLDLLFCLALPLACGGESPIEDGGAHDSGVASDAQVADAAVRDAGVGADATAADAAAADASAADAGTVDASPPAFTLESSAFMNGGAIPRRHSCRGVDLQPQLSWSNPPEGTMSFAIVFIDTSIDFTHWVAFDIPAATSALPEGASDSNMLPAGTREADAYCTQFCGPCPPNRHNYAFEILALDAVNVPFTRRGAFGQQEIDEAFSAHVLGSATLSGSFLP